MLAVEGTSEFAGNGVRRKYEETCKKGLHNYHQLASSLIYYFLFRVPIAGIAGIIQLVSGPHLVVVNKTDLVDEVRREEVISAVRGINSACQLITTVRSVVDLDLMLDLHAYDQICERPDKFEVELPFFSYINNIQPVLVIVG